MICTLLPLTKNKMEILKTIYEEKESHLSELAKQLKLHPFSVQKTLSKLKHLLKERKAGRTIILSINKDLNEYLELCSLIEDYKLKTEDPIVKLLIKNLQEFFSKDTNILCCIIFGSIARGLYNKESDIDLLFIVKSKFREIHRRCNQLASVLNKEINPLIMNEEEFIKATQSGEATIFSILEPSQRLIAVGRNYFLKLIADIKP